MLMVSNAFGAMFAGDSEFIKRLSLLKMVDHGHIVFIGTVVHKEYVTRPVIHITTDITMRVDTFIKGKPNLGDNHVKFMIQGGRFYSTRTGGLLTKVVSTLPEFEIGEQALLFLALPEERDNNAYAHYTYGGLHVMYSMLGKVPIVEDNVFFLYLRAEDSPIPVKMPLDLAVNMAKASLKDKDATVLLEDEIKALADGNSDAAITLSKALTTRLLTKSKEVANP